MKKTLSLVLLVAMLVTSLVVPAYAAEGNNSLRVDNTAVYEDGYDRDKYGSYFNRNYIYYQIPGCGRSVKNPDNGFNVLYKMDVKVNSYQLSDHLTSLCFAPFWDKYSFRYDFEDYCFKFTGMNGTRTFENPLEGYTDYQTVRFPFEMGEWHSIVVRQYGLTVQFYVDGYKLFDIDYKNIDWMYDKELWDYDVKEDSRNRWGGTGTEYDGTKKDSFFIFPNGCDVSFDNFGVYSADYNFTSGLATKVFDENNCDSYTGARGTKEDEMHGDLGELDIGIYVNAFSGTNDGCDGHDFNLADRVIHRHDNPMMLIESQKVSCVDDGYELYQCSCGMQEYRNQEKALGHCDGWVFETPVQATETEMGIEVRECFSTSRYSCGLLYKKIVPSTGVYNKALRVIPDTTTSLKNGYIDVNPDVLTQEGGVTFIMDVFPESHLNLDFARVGALTNGCFVGYSYQLGKFVIAETGSAYDFAKANILAESDHKFEDFEWQRWAFVSNDKEIILYVDGAEILRAEYDPAKKSSQWFLSCLGTQFYVDNITVADPDFDLETYTGTIYARTDLNSSVADDGHIVSALTSSGGFLCDETGTIHILPSSNFTDKHGFQSGSFNHEDKTVYTTVHVDRTAQFSVKYDSTPGDVAVGYSQINEASFNQVIKTASSEINPSYDFSVEFDFNATDWCTDEALLAADVKQGNSYTIHPTLGGFINDGTHGSNGFAGYDFYDQKFVIASIGSEHAYGMMPTRYTEVHTSADYTIKAGEWYKIKYHYFLNRDGNDQIDIECNGEVVLSYVFDYPMTLQWYIMYPAYVQGLMDNMKVICNGTVVQDTDFTDACSTENIEIGELTDLNSQGMQLVGGGYSIVDGGVPTHVYTSKEYPAGCTSDGYVEYTCSCGDASHKTYDVKALGHDWDEGTITTPATYDAPGVLTYKCSRCPETRTEEIAQLVIYGDANNDQKVTVIDVAVLQRYLNGSTPVTIGLGADVNGDGNVISTDLGTLRRYFAGMNIKLGPRV